MRWKLFPDKRTRLFFAIWICISCSSPAVLAQTMDFGKTYLNISKGLSGGTVETGDILEIRSSFVVRAGTYDSCGYTDLLPAGTTFISGSIRVLTNEGKVYKQFTDNAGDDCGWISGSTIRINLGYSTVNPASPTRRGRVASNHKPSWYGTTCIMIASYRVLVTASVNTDINTGGGSFTYKNGLNPVQTFSFPSNLVRVYPNYGTCVNNLATNILGTEFNGSFGTGQSRNRGTSAKVPPGYSCQVVDMATPYDTGYAIVNNTSTRSAYTLTNTWPKPDNSTPTHRVFSVWDIIGDHTGSGTGAGNPPADTVNDNSGYMLLLNAGYRSDSVFQHTVTGLCPGTYYEISCWVRNICSRCGCDSNGVGASDAGGPPYYIPTAPGDSAGVYPNISFDINGIDYYTTGPVRYTGQWVKKGFTYLTGPAQTSLTLKFFNNAPGGGGNDFAVDDITVAACSPSMDYSPSTTPIVCFGNPIVLYDTVSTLFPNNYTYYIWQRSTDNGLTWTNVSSPVAPASPYWDGSAWSYVSSYTVPPTATQLSDSADLYRLVTATSFTNLLNNNCRFTDTSNILTLRVLDCGMPLSIPVLIFSGQLINGMAVLNWTSSRENEPLIYDVERSTDGIHFTLAGQVYSQQKSLAESNDYVFTEAALPGTSYYRVKVRNYSGQFDYTRTIRLVQAAGTLSFVSVINPFSRQLRFDISSAQGGPVQAILTDPAGRVVRQQSFTLYPGLNRLSLDQTATLASGVYFLSLQSGEGMIRKTVLKQEIYR